MAAAAEAGVDSDPAVRTFVRQILIDPATARLAPVSSRLGPWERARKTWGSTHEEWSENSSTGAVEGTFLQGRVWAGRALQDATHPDPLQAALQSTFDALWTYLCARSVRGGKFVQDEHGQHRVDEPSHRFVLSARMQSFTNLALGAATESRPDWAALTSRLPAPLTDEQRQNAVQRDQERQAAGEFST